MKAEEDIDSRVLTYSTMVKMLLSTKSIKAAFVNCIDSELIVITRGEFISESLDGVRALLPIWLQSIQYSNDPSMVYSASCTKILRVTIAEIDGSPTRLMLMYPYLERIL
jgi:hypothetical protein